MSELITCAVFRELVSYNSGCFATWLNLSKEKIVNTILSTTLKLRKVQSVDKSYFHYIRNYVKLAKKRIRNQFKAKKE